MLVEDLIGLFDLFGAPTAAIVGHDWGEGVAWAAAQKYPDRISKLAVLQAVVNIGYVWLAVVAVLFSLIGAYYYLRLVKLMYFDAPEDTAPIEPRLDVRVLMSANGLAMLLFGIFPGPLMTKCFEAIQASL